MGKVFRYVVLLSLLMASLYLFNDQRKKLGAEGSKPKYKKPKAYTIEELQYRRDRIIENIQEGT